MHGWMGKLLHIDLGARTSHTEDWDPALLRGYLGGRGLGVKLYTDATGAGQDPLAPDNRLIFATGPLTSTALHTTGRFAVISRSPLTGTICDANSGGSWGVWFKGTGHDAVIITGAADTPLYLLITPDGVEFRDAADLWGKDCPTTRDTVIAACPKGTRVASIGPAGENRVLLAAIMNDNDRALGRGGMGAVMGSKNLKAIAVCGKQRPTLADPDECAALTKITKKVLKKNPVTSSALPTLGTSVLVNVINEHGMFPTRNFQEGVFNDAEGISGEKIAERILIKKTACYGCFIACGRKTRTATRSGEGPEYETAWSFGAQCGVSDLEAVAHANYTCNELGLDTISAGSVIGLAMELVQRGKLDADLHWGDADKMLQLVEDMAYQRGLGAELGEGTKRFGERYGAPELAMQSKGMEYPAYDPRGAQGQALAYATSNRGGCHMRAYLIGTEILGQPWPMDRFSIEGKPEMVVLFQDMSAAVDSLIQCRFVQFAMNPDHFAATTRAVTGLDIDGEEFLAIGERIWNLERLFNNREGFCRADDSVPPRFLDEPLLTGGSRGRVVQLDEMLAKYYAHRGWDDQGVPEAETLSKLGLEPLP